ncbi:MAG: DUF4867 family protein [Proteiniphilum sp.]
MGQQAIQNANSNLKIENISDESFSPFGKIIDQYDFSEVINYMEEKTIIPEEGNIYVASVPEMEQFGVKESLEKGFYGEMPIQLGYCNGRNSTLNGLEYHKGSEINIAVTDMVLILGKLQDVVDNKYDAENTKVFFVEKGKAIQLYETTLHFSPCKTTPDGFKCIVVLPKGTNEPLDNPKTKFGDKLLFARNKWLLAHPDRKPLMDKGAYPGIIGDNIEVKISK